MLIFARMCTLFQAQEVLGVNLSKGRSVRVSRMWRKKDLPENHKIYAALDAYTSGATRLCA